MTAYRRVPARDRASWSAAAEAGATALGTGAVLAHPTGTVYGLGAAAAARDRVVARMKRRDPDRPLLRIAPGVDELRRRHPELRWCATARRLAEAFWPGPLTLVLPDGSGEGLAVRVVDHPLTRRLLARAGRTMSSTSLNRSGRPPARTPEEVAAELDAMPEVDAEVVWVDAGALPPSPTSTIVSLLGSRPRLLREGALSTSEIEAALEAELERE